MTPKRIGIAALIVAIIFVSVNFSLVYINYLQLKTIMGDEAMDARRTEATEGEIENRIWARVEAGSAELPEEVEFEFEGVGNPEEDLIVYATYTDVVNLVVVKVPMDMQITAVASPPLE